jgi:hypothetical protein
LRHATVGHLRHQCPSTKDNTFAFRWIFLPSSTQNTVNGRERAWNRSVSAAALRAGKRNIFIGDEFRMEIELPNRNYLPLSCKAMYRFDNTGIGVKFVDVCEFEQELISRIIAYRLEAEGVPLQIDPFHPAADLHQR